MDMLKTEWNGTGMLGNKGLSGRDITIRMHDKYTLYSDAM
jgi:hypothetical protein